MVVAESLDDPRTGAVLREHPDEVVVVDPECVTEHLVDKEGTPTRAALDQTLTFFREKLGVGSGPGPRPAGMGAEA